jgi:hypothetical protein
MDASLLVAKRVCHFDDLQDEMEENEEMLSSKQAKMNRRWHGFVITTR